jgi:hypothetical protein
MTPLIRFPSKFEFTPPRIHATVNSFSFTPTARLTEPLGMSGMSGTG